MATVNLAWIRDHPYVAIGIVGGLGVGAVLILRRSPQPQAPAGTLATAETRPAPAAPSAPTPRAVPMPPLPAAPTPLPPPSAEPEGMEPIIVPTPEPPASPAPPSQPPMPVADQESPVRPTPLVPFLLERLELTKPWEFSRYRREAREIARKRREAYRRYYAGLVTQYRSGLDVRDIIRSTADQDNVTI